ncbi:MAG TPA: aspartate aminotransferase family protein [Candidatus Dormibacteraeota bacterium]
MLDQETALSRLEELDRTYFLHPMGDLGAPPGTLPQVIFTSGRGAEVTDLRGRTYIDAMASLWNVNVGHGRAELADAASEQMRSLAYTSAYNGFGSPPAIELAAKLAELAPGDLEVTFFASGGAEANDTAYKLARLYWYVQGQPGRNTIVSRVRDYHGLTLGAMAATGIDLFKTQFQPVTPGFLHAPSPDPYRYEAANGESAGVHYARAVEQVILDAGPETVAAVVVEPVQGAGGVIVPPPDYFPQLRQVCDRHGVLLIADEVITGFGRTGRWFAQEHWGIQADLMIFAKGVTSGYLPLSGVVLSRHIHDVLRAIKGTLPHGFTYSGHATACAVGLRNLQVIEEEGLVERAAQLGERLLGGLRRLERHRIVGNVRGLGLMAGIELVCDSSTKERFGPEMRVAPRVAAKALEQGVIVRSLPLDVVGVCPPFVISEEQLDHVVEVLDRAVEEVAADV